MILYLIYHAILCTKRMIYHLFKILTALCVCWHRRGLIMELVGGEGDAIAARLRLVRVYAVFFHMATCLLAYLCLTRLCTHANTHMNPRDQTRRQITVYSRFVYVRSPEGLCTLAVSLTLGGFGDGVGREGMQIIIVECEWAHSGNQPARLLLTDTTRICVRIVHVIVLLLLHRLSSTPSPFGANQRRNNYTAGERLEFHCAANQLSVSPNRLIEKSQSVSSTVSSSLLACAGTSVEIVLVFVFNTRLSALTKYESVITAVWHRNV